MNRFEWIEPRDLREALAAPAEDSALKAGGIDLLDLMKEGLAAPRRLVSLRALPELGRIEEAPGGLRIGAAVTLAKLAAHPLVRAPHRALAEAAGGAASPQIRNVATIGGNLLQRPRCWYFRSAAHYCARKGGPSCFAFAGENQYHALFAHNGCAIVHPSTPATALVALGARVELVAKGARRVVALEDFFLLPEQDIEHENDLRPGEILTAVLLPAPPAGRRSAHLRRGELDSFDWPLADVAVALDTAGDVCARASVVLGAAAPVPWRAKQAEAALAGRPVTEAAAREAARAALAGAMPLTHNAYKIPIFEALVRRAILAASENA